jgi:hypothetical protein
MRFCGAGTFPPPSLDGMWRRWLGATSEFSHTAHTGQTLPQCHSRHGFDPERNEEGTRRPTELGGEAVAR